MDNTEDLAKALAEFDQKNYDVAFKLFLDLANKNDPAALCNLATMYQCGLGVEANGEEAVRLYLIVANMNIMEGMLSGIAYNNLSEIYSGDTPGILRDDEKMNIYRDKAISLGFKMISRP